MRKKAVILMITIGMFASQPVKAEDYIVIPNMSQLYWLMAPDGRVYFRNLNSFNSTFQGCCFNYWLDTTTSSGKSFWAAILSNIATGQPMTFGFSSAATGGAIDFVGNWQ